VNDAGFFQNGYGIPGVQPDWIRVGATTTAQIVSINYNTNALTLANPISRSPGDPVYLYKDSAGRQVLYGNVPDIGAYPHLPTTHNYRVKQDGTGDFTTIQACANVAQAGDTCTVYSGTYAENVTVSAGTAGAYKTINVNGSDA